MGIQSSINSLLSQAQSLATFYRGFKKADDIIGDTTAAKGEAKIQTDIAAGNAPMKDGKVDPEWLQKRREDTHSVSYFYPNGKLTTVGEAKARILENKVNRGIELDQENKDIYNNPKVQDYLKSFREKSSRLRYALDTLESSISPEMQNKVAEQLARSSVEARTNSINKTKSNFDEHTASLIRYYGKGSGNP